MQFLEIENEQNEDLQQIKIIDLDISTDDKIEAVYNASKYWKKRAKSIDAYSKKLVFANLKEDVR